MDPGCLEPPDEQLADTGRILVATTNTTVTACEADAAVEATQALEVYLQACRIWYHS